MNKDSQKHAIGLAITFSRQVYMPGIPVTTYLDTWTLRL